MSVEGEASGRDAVLARLERHAPWIAALVALVAALATMTSDPIGVFNDDGLYLLTAKALANGQGYVYPHLPGTPPAIHYPPAWPFLLAVVWKLAPAFPANIGWLKLINPVVLAVAAALLVQMGRRLLGLPWGVALGGAVLATASVPVLLLTNLLLSEPLFLAVLVPTLVVTERLVKEGGWRRALLAAVLVALLVLVRTLGGVVLIAGILLLVRERRWRELALFGGGVALLLLPWQLFVWHASLGFPDELRGSYGPYLEWVADGYRAGGWTFLRDVVVRNVGDLWLMIGFQLTPPVTGVVRHLVAALAVLGFAAGFLVLLGRSRAPVTALALAGYFAVVLAWPFWVDRFVWVVWPLVILTGLTGAVTVATALQGRGRRYAARMVLALTAILGLGHLAYNVRGLAKGYESNASRDMAAAGVRLVRHVNEDRSLDGKVIAAELAPMMAIYSGLTVLPVAILTPREHLVDKTPAEQTAELERIDRRFRPDAYVMMRAGPYYPALLASRLDGGRTVIDVSPPGAPVGTLLIRTP